MFATQRILPPTRILRRSDRTAGDPDFAFAPDAARVSNSAATHGVLTGAFSIRAQARAILRCQTRSLAPRFAAPTPDGRHVFAVPAYRHAALASRRTRLA
jgi:hypothetical protein